MIHNNFWVFPDGTRRFIWFTVFSVSNRAQLSLQLVWNISSYVVLPFEIGAFIHFDLERGNYPPPIGWFDFLSFDFPLYQNFIKN